jgi:hypothetical protein
MTDPSWSSYREHAFGEPYLVWHDGPDFEEFRSLFDQDPELATRMLVAGIAEDDPLAAQTPRELDLTDSQRAELVGVLTRALPGSGAALRVEAGATLFALTGSAEWSATLVEVLRSPQHWSTRIDAAIRLAAFPPTTALVDALAEGVRDPEFLVRYHSANTLLRWAGRGGDVLDDPDLFPRLADGAGPAGWSTAAQELAEAVEP